MRERTYLVLDDGSIYGGCTLGASDIAYGEVVFTTSMTGYQEILTDPSYAGQIVVLTYPLVGNYGINKDDFESQKIQVAGLVVRESCHKPSHPGSVQNLDRFLKSYKISGITEVDTRAVVRRLRIFGVMMGSITTEQSVEETLARLDTVPRYDSIDFMQRVTSNETHRWRAAEDNRRPRIVVLDFGLKLNILRILHRLGCSVTVVPCNTSADIILEMNPDGILLSPGPGDPALLEYLDETVKKLVQMKPTMGICLGHQLISRAFGVKTYKLKFGHRGANHPVQDLETGRVFITAQNHGYAVDPSTVNNGLKVSQINLHDDTVEGLKHDELPILSIQYHSEASPGPWDNMYLFERFIEMVKQNSKK